MTLRVSGKNLDIGEALRQHVLEKVEAMVARYFGGSVGGHVVITREGFRLARYGWAEAARADRQTLRRYGDGAGAPVQGRRVEQGRGASIPWSWRKDRTQPLSSPAC